jgi:hypothetical protein
LKFAENLGKFELQHRACRDSMGAAWSQHPDGQLGHNGAAWSQRGIKLTVPLMMNGALTINKVLNS